jgi:hypothetical protein
MVAVHQIRYWTRSSGCVLVQQEKIIFFAEDGVVRYLWVILTWSVVKNNFLFSVKFIQRVEK